MTGWSASTDFPSADLPLDPPVTMPSLLSYGRRKLMIFDAQGVDEDLKVIDRRRFIYLADSVRELQSKMMSRSGFSEVFN